MPLAITDIPWYALANMPQDDVSTGGGAVDLNVRPEITQWAANNIAQIVSDGADTRTVTVTGRLASGIEDTEAIVANGTTPVSGSKVWERVMSFVTTTNASRIISIKEAAGGTIRATISLNETSRIIHFRRSSSAAGVVIRYEGGAFRNNHATLALTTAAVKLIADPAARIRIGVDTSKGGSSTIANRVTAPGGITFVDDNVSQAVPTGTLAATENIRVWIEENLPANDPPNKNTFTLELSGAST